VSTIAKIKYQVLPILDVERLQKFIAAAEISAALYVARFFIFFCNSYGPMLLLCFETFHPLPEY
jgi:hypothetical protein